MSYFSLYFVLRSTEVRQVQTMVIGQESWKPFLAVSKLKETEDSDSVERSVRVTNLVKEAGTKVHEN